MKDVNAVDKGFIQTYTARQFYFQDPTPEMIDIMDIGHALSNLCRYGGHSHRFYSVAEHCVLLSYYVEAERDKKSAFLALMHDSSEAYLVDMPRPIKNELSQYKTLEAKIEKAIASKYNFEFPLPDWMKDYDNRMLGTERLQTMQSNIPWVTDDLKKLSGVKLKFWQPWEAKEEFLNRFRELNVT